MKATGQLSGNLLKAMTPLVTLLIGPAMSHGVDQLLLKYWIFLWAPGSEWNSRGVKEREVYAAGDGRGLVKQTFFLHPTQNEQIRGLPKRDNVTLPP